MYQKASPTKDKYGNSLDIGQSKGMNPFQVGDAAMPQANGLMAMSAPMQTSEMGDAQGLMAAPPPVEMAQAAPEGGDLQSNIISFLEMLQRPRQTVPQNVNPIRQKLIEKTGIFNQPATTKEPYVHPFQQKLVDMTGFGKGASREPVQRQNPMIQALLKLGGR